MKKNGGWWRYSSTIRDLGIRWRGVVSYAPSQRYPRHLLDRGLVDAVIENI
jgi:hypothetical protein